MFEEGIRRVIKGLASNDIPPMTINELNGYLFGLAIVPTYYEPDDFLKPIFGGVLPKFTSIEQKELILDVFYSALDYYIQAFLAETLDFPFNYNLVNPNVKYFDKMREWCKGFLQSVYFNTEFWYLDGTVTNENIFINKKKLDYKQFVFTAFITCHMIGNYEEYRNNLLESYIKMTGINRDDYDEQQIEKSLKKYLLISFNEIYEVLLSHAYKQFDKVINKNIGLVRNKKIGRNDPCPCGSGKKYKHCCGKNY
jgi:uncharacterized protein YecA (UPF0149 family)